MYKLTITLEIATAAQRDDLLRQISGLLKAQPVAIQGKVKQSTEQEVVGGWELDLQRFGVEGEQQHTPIEHAIAEKRRKDAERDEDTLNRGFGEVRILEPRRRSNRE